MGRRGHLRPPITRNSIDYTYSLVLINRVNDAILRRRGEVVHSITPHHHALYEQGIIAPQHVIMATQITSTIYERNTWVTRRQLITRSLDEYIDDQDSQWSTSIETGTSPYSSHASRRPRASVANIPPARNLWRTVSGFWDCFRVFSPARCLIEVYVEVFLLERILLL